MIIGANSGRLSRGADLERGRESARAPARGVPRVARAHAASVDGSISSDEIGAVASGSYGAVPGWLYVYAAERRGAG